jgi:hypothetical protein
LVEVRALSLIQTFLSKHPASDTSGSSQLAFDFEVLTMQNFLLGVITGLTLPILGSMLCRLREAHP